MKVKTIKFALKKFACKNKESLATLIAALCHLITFDQRRVGVAESD